MSSFPPVPLTLEGSSALHQFFRFDWKAWKATPAADQQAIQAEFAATFKKLERANADGPVQSAMFSELGHKGDLILMHLRPTMEDLNRVELELAQTRFHDFLTQVHSYVSVVELGLYESSEKIYETATAKAAPHSPEWNAAIAESLSRPAGQLQSRIFPAVPEAKYLCFYPMNRKREIGANWFTVPFAERARMMQEHGLIGRRYGDRVRQIVTASIGFDDWEWGVSLFADDAVAFKKLIYEMRFDEISAVYALFGDFYLGVRLAADNLSGWLSGSQ